MPSAARADRRRPIFQADDYAEIREKYFADLRGAGAIDADPSGWIATYSRAEPLWPSSQPATGDIARYYIDEAGTIITYKERLAALLAGWHASPRALEEFTVCPSVALASLMTLATLKRLGVTRILFETPAYFASIEQATELGLAYELLPTYQSDGYALPDLTDILAGKESLGLWLTQPRAALGFNQTIAQLEEWLALLDRRHYLVVDEATDQSFPTTLGRLRHPRLIRLRSFTKGLGLNGLRLAAVLHEQDLRAVLVGSLEMLGGSVDVHSLTSICELAADLPRLQTMLAAANAQVNELRGRAERLVRGGPVRVNRLTNGYIGSATIDLTNLGVSHRTRRKRLLEGCRDARTPVILGASFYLAYDPPFEAVRLNFFSHPQHILGGLANIQRIVE